MMPQAAVSLESRLVRRLVSLQGAMLTALVLFLVGTLSGSGILLHQRDEEQVIDVLRAALARDDGGDLVLRPTAELRELRSATPRLWFSIRDRQGQVLSEGKVPPEFMRIGNTLDDVGQAKLGWDLRDDDPRRPAARLKRVDTAAGNVQILTTTDAKISRGKAVLNTALLFAGLILPGLLLMTLTTFIATPIVVRGALAGLGDAADRARQIDTDKRGTRLPVANVPAEIAPLVRAVNDALARLDKGYERHKRFLADAAHELRTPIAILNTRLEALPQGAEKTRLVEDVARLATLAEQLLDLQRLEHGPASFSCIDLVAIGRNVAADLAPLAIAAGYDISFESETEHTQTQGDHASIERALTNLVQNSIQHGGRAGTISITVRPPGTIDVTDEGPGVPEQHREQIFEPFHRLQSQDRGAGLGLNLVREIVRMHHGQISVGDGPRTGACFRMTLPAMSAPTPDSR